MKPHELPEEERERYEWFAEEYPDTYSADVIEAILDRYESGDGDAS